jgi:uncharacterized membrane protein
MGKTRLEAFSDGVIIRAQGADSPLKRAIGGDWKGKLSPVLYLLAIAVSFWVPAVSLALYVVVALIWLVPDPRIERRTVVHH